MDASLVINCKPVSGSDNALLNLVEKTYNDSFPIEERRDFSLVRNLLHADRRFMMYALLKEERYVGFITSWQLADFVYLEHFAIDESARNGGIGAAAMKSFLAFHKGPAVLEVEMPVEEMSKRRIGFYERLGFVLDNHTYHQPPYRAGYPWLEMRLMTYGDLDLGKQYEHVKAHIYRQVYGVE